MGLVLHLVDGGCMTAHGDPGAWRFPAASVVVSGPAQRVGRSLLRQLVSLRASWTQNGLHSTDGIRGCLRCVSFCYAMMVLGGGVVCVTQPTVILHTARVWCCRVPPGCMAQPRAGHVEGSM